MIATIAKQNNITITQKTTLKVSSNERMVWLFNKHKNKDFLVRKMYCG
jgi:hypothetical protein